MKAIAGPAHTAYVIPQHFNSLHCLSVTTNLSLKNRYNYNGEITQQFISGRCPGSIGSILRWRHVRTTIPSLREPGDPTGADRTASPLRQPGGPSHQSHRRATQLPLQQNRASHHQQILLDVSHQKTMKLQRKSPAFLLKGELQQAEAETTPLALNVKGEPKKQERQPEEDPEHSGSSSTDEEQAKANAEADAYAEEREQRKLSAGDRQRQERERIQKAHDEYTRKKRALQKKQEDELNRQERVQVPAEYNPFYEGEQQVQKVKKSASKAEKVEHGGELPFRSGGTFTVFTFFSQRRRLFRRRRRRRRRGKRRYFDEDHQRQPVAQRAVKEEEMVLQFQL